MGSRSCRSAVLDADLPSFADTAADGSAHAYYAAIAEEHGIDHDFDPDDYAPSSLEQPATPPTVLPGAVAAGTLPAHGAATPGLAGPA